MMTDEHSFFSTPGGMIIGLLMILGGLFIYFLPSIIGMDKEKRTGIFVLNLLLGWSVLGWIGALIWGISSAKKAMAPGWNYTCNKCGYKNALNQPVKIYKCPQCGEERTV